MKPKIIHHIATQRNTQPFSLTATTIIATMYSIFSLLLIIGSTTCIALVDGAFHMALQHRPSTKLCYPRSGVEVYASSEIHNENDNISDTDFFQTVLNRPFLNGSSMPSILLAVTIFVIPTMVILPTCAAAAVGEITRGASLFNNNCASCHRGGENIMKPSKTLYEKDLVKNLKSADRLLSQLFSRVARNTNY